MKNKGACVKCNSNNIKIISAVPIKITTSKLIKPKYYLCNDCGYMEMWLDNNKEEIGYIDKI
ncbi:hypothetical protein K5V21_12855 [Clostridium sardiniense]|uniref:Uncharacterized protein n=1 Tax=Clostridium sardiniense TaxID=29369 RepID=A0ABS7KZU8_CLOSR|nr:hypothetical protein [Clostridium sardiniense]MBY0756338.1 hypothetical protein [Clostridium sardiniense]MDQ0461495.1 putative nucleic-acid-binding Zn-ribbon protein [Clostridium sardiniense]